MTLFTLAFKSLRYYRWQHAGVVLGAAAATAILVGALAVGDCVRYSLERMALERLGNVTLALPAGERMFRQQLAGELAGDLHADVAAVLTLPGSAVQRDSGQSAGGVQILGVDDAFWRLAPKAVASQNQAGVVLNTALAQKLKAKVGQSVLLRVQKPSALPRDAILAKADDLTASLDLAVTAIVGPEQFGAFNLRSDPTPPLNAFVPREVLAKAVGTPERANLLMTADAVPEIADSALRKHWQLADAGVELRSVPEAKAYELRTARVFLEDPVLQSVEDAGFNPKPARVLTYFVNELKIGDRTTPYSMVSALDPSVLAGAGAKAVADLHDDQIAINAWLAEDLAAKVGDELILRYYVLGPTRQLKEQTSSFRVAAIIPMEQLAGGSELMPLFPGLHDAASCRDWRPGFGINLERLRDKDQNYWERYRGTPKAFISSAAGRKIWANPFGSVTALRFPAAPGATADGAAKLAPQIEPHLTPAALSLSFQPVRQQALRTARGGTDFGMLFLGLSFFLIAAALLLVGLLFSLSVQRRGIEAGTLLALGLTSGQVRRLMLLEGLILALLGGLIGTLCGLIYTKAVLEGLGTVWRSAAGGAGGSGGGTGGSGGAGLQFHVEPATLATGATAGVVMALLTIGWTLWRLGRKPARVLLAGEAAAESMPPAARKARPRRIGASWWIAAGAMLAATALLAASARTSGDKAGAFFGAAALLLLAVLSAAYGGLVALARKRSSHSLNLTGVALRSVSRRRGRSLATVILLACGCFLVVAVGLNRQDPTADAEKRSSGTGGFALFGQTTLPVLFDFNTSEGQEALGLDDPVARAALKDVAVVPLRVHDGDDASCLSLGRAQAPRLLGVNPQALAQRGAFTFSHEVASSNREDSGWTLLDAPQDADVVAAVGDEQTVVWGLHASVGAILPDVRYVDERGRTFRIRIVGILNNSILQGSLLISEGAFSQRFPSESGWRMLLIDAPGGHMTTVAQTLADAPQLKQLGLELTPARDRLALFSSVEETYLSIFQALGGLGLILGSVGLGAVVLRNVLERRGELAAMRAIGFSRSRVALLVLGEHWLLLFAGLLCGIAAGTVAVWPALAQRGTDLPLVSMGVTLAAVLISGVLWTVLAAGLALSGPIMAALRAE